MSKNGRMFGFTVIALLVLFACTIGALQVTFERIRFVQDQQEYQRLLLGTGFSHTEREVAAMVSQSGTRGKGHNGTTGRVWIIDANETLVQQYTLGNFTEGVIIIKGMAFVTALEGSIGANAIVAEYYQKTIKFYGTGGLQAFMFNATAGGGFFYDDVNYTKVFLNYPEYVFRNGSRELTANWDAGPFNITASGFDADDAGYFFKGTNYTHVLINYPEYVFRNGSRELTANWDAGPFNITAAGFDADAAGYFWKGTNYTHVLTNYPEYVFRNGSRELTANWDAGPFNITAAGFDADAAGYFWKGTNYTHVLTNYGEYVFRNGSRELTANWDAGPFNITASGFDADDAGYFFRATNYTHVFTNYGEYVFRNGSRELTANWDAGPYNITASGFNADDAGYFFKGVNYTGGMIIHAEYVLRNGTRELTANWDAGAFNITASGFDADDAGYFHAGVNVTTNILDDHSDYLDKDGTVELTANWDVGPYNITVVSFNATTEITVSNATAEIGKLTIYGKDKTVLQFGDATHEGGDIVIYEDALGNKSLEFDADAGQLRLPVTGIGGGLLLGGDCLLYRIEANRFGLNDFLRFIADRPLEFRDAAITISSKNDGHLDLDADISVDINADLYHNAVNVTANILDDHTDYLNKDGTVALTANWDVGAFNITASGFDADTDGYFFKGVNYTANIIDPGFNYTNVMKDGAPLATRLFLNFINGTNNPITLTDDPGNDYVNITINDTVFAGVGNYTTASEDSGAAIGTRAEINFINGTGTVEQEDVNVDLVDDAAGNQINITVFTATLNASALADHEYIAFEKIYGQAGEALAIGEIAFYNGTDGKYYKSDSNSTTTMYAVGVVPVAIGLDAWGIIVYEGFMRDDSWSALTPGSDNPIYAGWVAGSITSTIPNKTGDQVQVIGFPIAAQIAFFDFDSTVVEVG